MTSRRRMGRFRDEQSRTVPGSFSVHARQEATPAEQAARERAKRARAAKANAFSDGDTVEVEGYGTGRVTSVTVHSVYVKIGLMRSRAFNPDLIRKS